MPFTSRAQQKACYAKNDPNWDCKKFGQDKATPSQKMKAAKMKKKKK